MRSCNLKLIDYQNKIKGYVNIANKANYLIIGADNLKQHNKKLYLILADTNSGKNLIKIVNAKSDTVPVIFLENLYLYTGIENCKIVGIKNLGLSEQILKIVKEQKI